MKASFSSPQILSTLLATGLLIVFFLIGLGEKELNDAIGPLYRFIIFAGLLLALLWTLGENFRAALNDEIKQMENMFEGKIKKFEDKIKEIEEDHYSLRLPQKERAYRIIHRLLLEGEFLENANPGLRRLQDWDKEVIKALVANCNSGALQHYLIRTHRAGDDGSVTLIQERYYHEAILTLQSFIREDLENRLK